MRINRFIVGLIALVLVAGALTVALQTGGRSNEAGAATEPAALATGDAGKPTMAPPVLPAASAAELQSIDARGAAAFHSDPLASGPYSGAEMSAHGNR